MQRSSPSAEIEEDTEPVSEDTRPPRYAPLSVTSFVLLLAALMCINALTTDIMLPAFPDMSSGLGNVPVTELQAIIPIYMLGFGISQLFVGFLADRFGRRPVLIVGLVFYSFASIATALSGDLNALLLARFVQGIGSAAPRVISQAAVRDCFEGRAMARIMSLVLTVFLIMPVIAPSVGQVILFTSSWRWVLGSMAIFGLFLLVVSAFFMPETLHPSNRRPIRFSTISYALKSVFGNRQTVGYTVSAGVFFGALFGYVGSSQPILSDVYGVGEWFAIVFAGIALFMSLSSFLNASLVERFGMRLLSHGATVAAIIVSLAMLGADEAGLLTLWVYLPLQGAIMLMVGLTFANFNALAMEPQGHVAGVAASFTGATTVVLGASIGYVIASHYDGTVTPVAFGFAICSIGTLIVLLITERGQLFVPHHAPPRKH
ncbi:MAG: multidrug effflux MFS transporter [Salaquimonas sp.]|nr:multidrug effflux MFS transporter [Salaquimonas sp.]